MLVALSLLENFEEVLLRAGVFGEDVGEAVASFVGVVGVAGFTVVDADPSGVFAVEGFGFGAALFGEEVGDYALCAGTVGTGVGGEFGFVVGAVLVAVALGFAFALAGAGGFGELAAVVGVAAADGLVGAVGDGGGGLGFRLSELVAEGGGEFIT